MELAKINNYIKLANSDLTELLRVLEFDRQQAIMQEKGKSYKLATAVKKVIDQKDLKKSRPLLATIMHDKDGKQFICDGYMLIKWKDYQEELNGFLQTEYAQSIKDDTILPKEYNTVKHELSVDDKLIIKNIDKYIKLYKNDSATGLLPIRLFGKFYSASFIKNAFDIIGEINHYHTTQDGEIYPIYIYENGIEGILLPVRVLDEKIKQEADTKTQSFLAKLKVA